MRSLVLAFVAGTSYLQTRAELPSHAAIGLMFFCAVVFVVLSHYLPRLPLKLACLLATGLFAGCAWAAAFAHLYLAVELLPGLEGQDITIIGTVASLPARGDEATRFTFLVERIVAPLPAPVVPGKLALSWYAERSQNSVVPGGSEKTAGNAGGAAEPGQSSRVVPGMPDQRLHLPTSAMPAPQLQPGERWQLTVRLRRPHGNANPYGFDYEAWLLEQNLRATGSVRDDGASALKNRRLAAFVPGLANGIERLRAGLRQRILQALEGQPYAGVMVALVVGDQREIAQSDWQIFNRSGIGHLISIK
ncbi:MAG: ComEC/Rec2 family competence protein [Janthinobacterium lividum]